MPRVLVLGATGYLGQSVTQSLVRSGLHDVYGICRSSSKAKILAAIEVSPVISEDPANAPEPFLAAIRRSNIDVVVDCAAAYGDSAKLLAHVTKAGKERLDAFKAEDITSPPRLGYVYVSGGWVHGDSDRLVSDLDPVGTASAATKPLDIVAWRPELERAVLASRDVLDVLIFRPAQMYGRSSSAWGALWGPLANGIKDGKSSITVPAPPNSQSPVIHVDDIADAISLGVGKISLLGGTSVYPVFDVVSSTENIRDVIDAFAKALLADEGKSSDLKFDFVGPGDDVYLKALTATVRCNSSRARELLGWEPKRVGLVSKMEVYAGAWKAGQ
ncbi:hypothetical protein H2200_010382 [Cladophialophora chaetospira]|uniref:NAD-dependent epimerase/dehydratase domain-containing protein n=1 Tax=Cladophialophora chaetospira TaxID=386627 RepID=A0AA38X1F1_9EURO|nr:hypothetical protein H2200_010382 [Cladophialophora chaetospira]